MATLRVKLEESKTEPKAVFVVECSNDIKDNIVQASKDMFEVEMIKSGSIITTADSTTIQMIVTDSEKNKIYPDLDYEFIHEAFKLRQSKSKLR